MRNFPSYSFDCARCDRATVSRRETRPGRSIHAGGEIPRVLRPQAARPAAMHHACDHGRRTGLLAPQHCILVQMLRRICWFVRAVIRLARHHFEYGNCQWSGQDILARTRSTPHARVQQCRVAETPPETPPDTGERRLRFRVEARARARAHGRRSR